MDTEKPEFQHKQMRDGCEVAVEAGESQPTEPMPKWAWEITTPSEEAPASDDAGATSTDAG